MGEEDLQININAVDNATEQLNAVASTADEMAQTVGEAASSIDEALGGSEEAVSQYTQTWEESLASLDEMMSMSEMEMNQMLGVTEETTSQMSAAYQSLAGLTGTTADEISQNLTGITAAQQYLTESAAEASGAFDDSMGGMAVAAATAAGEITSSLDDAGAAAQSTGESTFGYFHNLILGLMAQQAGKAGQSFIDSIVNASTAGAATDQIKQLRNEIQQTQASMEQQRASLENTVGTSDQLAARYANVNAQLSTEATKIELLKRQLDPLVAQQKAAGDAGKEYALAMIQLNTSWQTFLATLGGSGFVAMLTQQVEKINEIVKSLTAWAKANPELVKEILEFIGLVSEMLIVLGGLAIIWAMVALAFTAGAGPFLLAAIAIGLVAAAVVSFWPQIQNLLDYIDKKTGVVTAIKNAWKDLSKEWEDHFMPDIKQLWDDLKPLMPYLEGAGAFIAGTLVTQFLNLADTVLKVADAIVKLVDGLAKLAEGKESIGTAIGNVGKYFTGGDAASLLQSAVGGLFPGVSAGLSVHPLADGGIVSSPTLALVGEAGPEAVIPLSAFNNGLSLAGSGSRGGTGGITVNITGTFLSQDAARQLSQMIITSLNRQVRLSSFV